MKKRFLLIAALFFGFSQAHATDPIKIGYVNLEMIMTTLPDSKKIENDLHVYEKQLRTELERRAGAFQKKLENFQKESASLPEAEKNKKEEELKKLHKDIEEFQYESQNSLVNKQMELLKPFLEEIQKAIEAVAKENKYTHVFNLNVAGNQILLYGDKEHDLSDKVKKKLETTSETKQKTDKNVPKKPAQAKSKTNK